MALTNSMSLEEIERFLKEEVKEQIFLEIAPILHVGKGPGGYFGVGRQVLCLIDFLGALYSGYEGKGKIATTDKAVKYIEEMMGEIDPNYKINGKVMHLMFRNGLVHTYQPKTFVDDKDRKLQWLPYKGTRYRHDMDLNDELFKGVRHLGIVRRNKFEKTYCLCVSINTLHDDLLTSIDMFVSLLQKDKNAEARFVSAANAIYDSEEYNWKEKIRV